jgi:hypothetical protein
VSENRGFGESIWLLAVSISAIILIVNFLPLEHLMTLLWLINYVQLTKLLWSVDELISLNSGLYVKLQFFSLDSYLRRMLQLSCDMRHFVDDIITASKPNKIPGRIPLVKQAQMEHEW